MSLDMPMIILPAAVVLFLALLVGLPMVRLRMRTGVWGIVVRNNDPGVETFVRYSTVGVLAGVAVWSVLVVTVSASGLAIWPCPAWLGNVGIGLLAVGFAVIAIAQAQMGASWRIGIDDEPTGLVTHGLYRFVRHPIYTGILALFAAIVCLTPSPWTVSGLVLGAVMIGLQSRLEDDHVKSQHPTEFALWAARVGRLIPGLGRLGKRTP